MTRAVHAGRPFSFPRVTAMVLGRYESKILPCLNHLMRTTPLLRALALVLTVTSTALHAQVPQIINYQGRVAVGNPPVNFSGSGQFKFALVQGEGPTLLWKNDGSAGNTEPTAAVTLPVTKGLYSVLLGANMTAIPNSVFANPDVRLRVWFSDGTNGSQLLTPDQRIAAVGYAMVASTLQSGATITSSTAAPAATFANSTDNPAALKLSTPYRTWWLGQNKAPDAKGFTDEFFIYDQQSNATRLRIDLGGVIYGNGAGLTGVTSTGFTGNLAGDVTGAQGTTVVANVGGVTAANVAAGASLANAATTASTPNTLVKRDGSGNIPGVTPASTVPPGMVLIPAGAFTMGNSVAADADITTAAPVSTTVSAFYMDVTEVTLSQWQSVYYWATSNGYTFAAGAGKGPNHPVQTVTWYDVVKWCNARSEQAGKVPVYYTDDAQTTIYKTGNVNVTNAQVKWTANGYRLPTEAEWEKAARGGRNGQRFPWGNTITQNLANYYGNTAFLSYDLGPNGYNAIGSIGGTNPATSPVGTFAANGYGLSDMAGNVLEWCWDWYGTPYAGGTDPHGATTGSSRVLRGGYWNDLAHFARCAFRRNLDPVLAGDVVGFRAVLAPGQ